MIGIIKGTGSYIPEKVLHNDDLAEMVETNDAWIRERTGIVNRHIAEKVTTVDMAIQAGKRAMENAGIQAGELDMIIVSTVTSNMLIPCTACEVQKAIGAVSAVCFDINAACSGFLFAYHTAQCYIGSGFAKKILMIGAESLSNIINWEDRSTGILFGDGAGAAVLTAREGERFPIVMHSDGFKGEALYCETRHQKNWEQRVEEGKTLVTMDGPGVFKFAVRQVPAAVLELLEKLNMDKDEIDYFVIHQANLRIIEAVAKRVGVGMDKFPTNLEKYGNTSSASIPILLDELNREKKLKKGMKIILAGFGAGLSWSASYLEWDQDPVL